MTVVSQQKLPLDFDKVFTVLYLAMESKIRFVVYTHYKGVINCYGDQWLISPNNPCRAIPTRIDIFRKVTTLDLQPLRFCKPRKFLRESYCRATSSTMARVWIIAEWRLFLNWNCNLILTKSSQFCIWPWRVLNRFVVYTLYKGVINCYGDQWLISPQTILVQPFPRWIDAFLGSNKSQSDLCHTIKRIILMSPC